MKKSRDTNCVACSNRERKCWCVVEQDYTDCPEGYVCPDFKTASFARYCWQILTESVDFFLAIGSYWETYSFKESIYRAMYHYGLGPT